MKQFATLTQEEAVLLNGAIGKRLDLVTCWHPVVVYLHIDGLKLRIEPEEISTPTRQHEYSDVTRPCVKEGFGNGNEDELKTVAKDLGVICEVSVLTTLVSSTPSEPVGPIKITEDYSLPAGTAYGAVLTHPAVEASLDVEYVESDIGIRFKTNRDRSITIFTDAVGYWVYANVDGEYFGYIPKETFPEDFDSRLQEQSLSVRL